MTSQGGPVRSGVLQGARVEPRAGTVRGVHRPATDELSPQRRGRVGAAAEGGAGSGVLGLWLLLWVWSGRVENLIFEGTAWAPGVNVPAEAAGCLLCDLGSWP